MGFVTMFSYMYTMHFNQIHPSAPCLSLEGDYSQPYIYKSVAFHFINCEPLREASYQRSNNAFCFALFIGHHCLHDWVMITIGLLLFCSHGLFLIFTAVLIRSSNPILIWIVYRSKRTPF